MATKRQFTTMVNNIMELDVDDRPLKKSGYTALAKGYSRESEI